MEKENKKNTSKKVKTSNAKKTAPKKSESKNNINKNLEQTKTLKKEPEKKDTKVKPQNINTQKLQTEENEMVKRFIIVLLIVVISVVGIYFFTRAFVSKDLFEDKKDKAKEMSEITFNYDKTILGATFNRPYDEYYVISYNSTDKEANNIATLITNYTAEENHIKIYYADLADHLNKVFYDKENVNPKATKASELKVGDYTLIKIKNKTINKYIEGIDNITKELE